MERLAMWVGGGVIGVGVSAAALAGAGTAAADNEPAPNNGRSAPSAPSAPGATHRSTVPAAVKQLLNKADSSVRSHLQEAGIQTPRSTVRQASGTAESPAPSARRDKKALVRDLTQTVSKMFTTKENAKETGKESAAGVAPADRAEALQPLRVTAPIYGGSLSREAAPLVESVESVVNRVQTEAARRAAAGNTVVDIIAKQLPADSLNVFGLVSNVREVLPAPVKSVGGLAFQVLAAAEKALVGKPVLPPNSNVTVRSSTLQLSNGQTVPADWYFPDTDEPPQRMIYLQHGFLATGPMYSFTAAYLAQSTGSVVVAPTMTSDFIGSEDNWLGGDGTHKAVADLFLGNREALNRSARDAGYAQQYGLNPEEAVLPRKFALVGHSLGGALVAGTSGHLADSGAADDLVGVILLDGVPTGSTMVDALQRVDDYEERSGHSIPIREIGAPLNMWNFVSNANQGLMEVRPDDYKGVVLVGGVHMDSMQGGNQLIQNAAYLLAGNPLPQNRSAVPILMGQWLNAWFGGDPELLPEDGSIIDISTDDGVAHAVVIGKPAGTAVVAPMLAFLPSSVTSLPDLSRLLPLAV